MMGILQKFVAIAKKYLHKALVRIVSLESVYKEFHNLHSLFSESVTTPEVTDMLFFPDAKHLQSKTYSLPIIYTIPLNEVFYCAEYNILLTSSRKIISESISTQKDLKNFDFSALFLRRVEKVSGICSIFRSHRNGYYHTLIDNIPRLYLLHQTDFKDIEEIKLLCPGELTQVEMFFLEKLLPENVTITRVDKNKLYLVEDLIFPSFLSRRFAGYLPGTYISWFLAKVNPQRPRKKDNRIFISRIKTERGSLRCILNEDELFDVLQDYGFKKYILDQMSIEDQINLFYDAEFVVAAHGAGLSNIIFSEQIKVLELFPMQFVLPHYYYLAKALEHHYQYWCGEEKSRDSNFRVNVSTVSEILAASL
jgi:hypothetical protein